jgi:hypothetical protein
MGRRSRKRAGAEAPAVEPRAPAPEPRPVGAPSLKSRREEAPEAPWHPFPLVELSVLAGIVLMVIGFTRKGDDRPALLFGGLALVSIASFEVAIREHFGGYRSHTMLLTGAVAVGAAAGVGVTAALGLWPFKMPQEALLAVGVVAGAVAFRALRAVFVKRSRGLTWRV